MSKEEILNKIKSLKKGKDIIQKEFYKTQAAHEANVEMLEQRRKDIRDEKHKLEFLSDIQVGDKVEISGFYDWDGVSDGKRFVSKKAIISRVLIRVRENDEIEFYYRANKIKKDGSMSDFALVSKMEDYERSRIKVESKHK